MPVIAPLAFGDKLVPVSSDHAPVAQLDRASASGAEGQRFESSRAYHSFNNLRYPPFRYRKALGASPIGRLFFSRRSYNIPEKKNL